MASHIDVGDMDEIEQPSSWSEAYNPLNDRRKDVLSKYLSASSPQALLDSVGPKIREFKANKAQLRLPGGKKIKVHNLFKKIVYWISKFIAVGDVSMQCDPVHAALSGAAI